MKSRRWWLAIVATLLTPWMGPHVDRYMPVGWLLVRGAARDADRGFWIIAAVVVGVGCLVWVSLFSGLAAWFKHRSRREAMRLVARAGGDRSRARHGLVAFLVSSAAALTPAAPLAQSEVPVGTWEYRQRNTASPTGVDPEGERLVIAQAGGQVVITYFGLEREGAHGLYYTAVRATNARRIDANLIAFTVPARNLYRTRPKTLADADRLEPAGMVSDSLLLTAERRGQALIVNCTSSDRSCPESTMAFRRLRGGR